MTGLGAKRRISYVFPIYNEATNIAKLWQALSSAVAPVLERYEFEFVFVDDGSKDASLELLLALRDADDRVKVLSFSRNFGHQAAVTAGLDAASGDAVIIMDSDLQDPPSVSLALIDRWEAGAQVVYAQRRTRKDGAFKRWTAWWFYWVLSKLASIDIPRNTGDFRLLDRRVVLELRRYREHDRFLRGMVSHVGFQQEAVLFDREDRHSGVTGYPLRKMIKFAIDGILGFSIAPIQIISRLGVAISMLSFVGMVYVLLVRLLDPAAAVPGWAFVMVAMFFLGGIQLIVLGVLGSYVGRIYVEAQGRPLYSLALVAGEVEHDEQERADVRPRRG